MVFNHIDHAVPPGIDTAIRKTKALRMRELSWSWIFPSLAIQLLICKIGEIDAVSMNQRGSSSILMNSGPDVERSWCDVTNLAVWILLDQHRPTSFLGPGLNPAATVLQGMRRGQADGTSNDQIRADG